MAEFEKTEYNKVIRGTKRASYDKNLVHQILDAHFLCHIAYQFEGTAIAIPTAYGRKENRIFIHGSLKNRMMLSLLNQEKASLTVTHLDGLVLARSAFHHSANYRSVTVFGKAKLLNEPSEKMEALRIITENMVAGRWDEIRLPNEKELNSTLVIAIEIETASAKVRAEGAVDDPNDLDLDIWAGVIPFTTISGKAIQNEDCSKEIAIPDSVLKFSFS